MGLAPVIKEENFKFNDDTGFYCFVNITREIDCVSEKTGQDSTDLCIGRSLVVPVSYRTEINQSYYMTHVYDSYTT